MNPEDKEAAMSEAVERMAKAAFECEGGVASRGHRDWTRAGERNQDIWRAEAEAALRVLLSPSVTDCETCAGRGYAYQCDDPADESIPCPAGCDHGQVTRPSLMRFNRIASEGDTR